MEQKNYLLDMDGVLIRGNEPIPGAGKFIANLTKKGIKYLVFTNNPLYTQRDLAHRLQAIGIDIPAERFFTSSMATACFLKSQHPHGRAFVVGESGLTQPLYEAGYIITDIDPDYVVLGETFAYSIDQLTKAIRFISKGALFIATNPDNAGMENEGLVPACGALAALVERATGQSPFYVGKPNPIMMRFALNYLGMHSANTIMVGDRMDTDVIAGMMSGIETILVLSGVGTREEIEKYAYRPTRVVNSVADIELK
jgi:NagD protein